MMPLSLLPFSANLSFRKREKSHRAKSGEHRRCEKTDIPVLTRIHAQAKQIEQIVMIEKSFYIMPLLVTFSLHVLP
jgi:hypothetical protein